MSYTNGLDNPELYFQTKIYSGTGSSLALTLDGSENMQPDWVWFKRRDGSANHHAYTSVTGVTGALVPNDADPETTGSLEATNYFSSFDSDGFTLAGGNYNNSNKSGQTYVAWCWKAGTSFSNDASATSIGTIDSTGSASDTAGFSTVLYTGTGSAGTVKHGLSSAPSIVLIKNRSASGKSWIMANKNIGFGNGIYLNLSDASASEGSAFNSTAPTTSVFTVGTTSLVNDSGNTYIAYCFAEKKGYSKFGSYTGNGNADGSFIYTGQKSAFIMFKNTSNAQNWYMYDNKRSDFNLSNDHIYADLSNAETADSSHGIDILSNGFKIRTSNDGWNGSGENYIYMAFAENPFVTSTGVPATAR